MVECAHGVQYQRLVQALAERYVPAQQLFLNRHRSSTQGIQAGFPYSHHLLIRRHSLQLIEQRLHIPG